MNPQIAAALIAVGGAVIGVAGVVGSVLVAAKRTRKQKRGELAASAMSDYVKALAQSAAARGLKKYAASLSNGKDKERIVKEALDVERQSQEIGAHAKAMLLAFADSDTLLSLARWDRNPDADDIGQQPLLLEVINGVRLQIDTDADSVPESIGLGLMFGWPDST
ncbi:MAG TPA: hypothetical protein VGY13_01355 [Solirubrobacteraceae bacterium]|jgi:hypothetical protein|nr:hypothetical protein [Solirubrobacteraceae bacterium]